jgi:ATP synthase I chain.
MSNREAGDSNPELISGVRRLLLQMPAWAALAALILCIAGCRDKIPGFLVGTVISLVYGLLICYRVQRSASLPPRKAAAYMRTGWLLRLAFIVLALVWALKVPLLNFGAVVAGLLSLQVIIFLNGFYLVIRHLLGKESCGERGDTNGTWRT